jgi:hypothetical protein
VNGRILAKYTIYYNEMRTVCLGADGASQKMGHEHPGERWFLLDHPDNSRFFGFWLVEATANFWKWSRSDLPAVLSASSTPRKALGSASANSSTR